MTAAMALALAVILSAASPARAGLGAHLDSIVQAAGLGSNVRASISVLELGQRELLVESNADEPMMPASNMKLLTTAAALSILGNEFKFRTELRMTRGPEGGVVLIVRGDGDPAFGDPDMLADKGRDIENLLDEWTQAVVDAGIEDVTWLVMDDRVFDRELVHPSWPRDQLKFWYCAQVSGINIHDNCLDLFPRPGRTPGAAPELSMSPRAPFVTVMNRAVTGKADRFGFERESGTNHIRFWGEVKNRATRAVNVTIDNPPVFFAMLLAHRLAERGIKVGQVGRPRMEKRLPEGKLLHVTETPLADVVKRTNKDSQNLFAEALLKRIGRELSGSPGSWSNGAAAMRMFLHDRINSQAAAVQIADGSGLSRDNRVTTRVMVEVIGQMHGDPHLGAIFRDSLSVGGVDGTLRRRFENDLRGRVIGKSGYISQVSALSGVVYLPEIEDSPTTGRGSQIDDDNRFGMTDDSSEPPTRGAAFSLIFNGFKPPIYNSRIKALQDKLVEAIEQELARRDPAPAMAVSSQE